MTTKDVIAAFGTAAQFARACGVSQVAVFNWKQNGIPPRRWRQIADLAQARGIDGITVETLSMIQPEEAA